MEEDQLRLKTLKGYNKNHLFKIRVIPNIFIPEEEEERGMIGLGVRVRETVFTGLRIF